MKDTGWFDSSGVFVYNCWQGLRPLSELTTTLSVVRRTLTTNFEKVCYKPLFSFVLIFIPFYHCWQGLRPLSELTTTLSAVRRTLTAVENDDWKVNQTFHQYLQVVHGKVRNQNDSQKMIIRCLFSGESFSRIKLYCKRYIYNRTDVQQIHA